MLGFTVARSIQPTCCQMSTRLNGRMNQLPNAVKNQSLFSNYYLDSLIVEQPQWAQTPDIESDYAAIKELFDAVVPDAEHFKEAQTERQFIQPVLKQLGHIFEVQPTLQTSQGTREPDYAFFPSESVLNTAQSHINTNQFFTTAFAVGDAKAWSRNLDRKVQGRGDPFNNQNPSYQIDFYLRGADKDWGILTNGGQWRLYHRQTSYQLDSFYEVDLAAILSENGNLDAFRYFYNLFRRDAFIPDPSGTSFLDLVLGESQQYTVAVSDDLKNRVYDALRLLIDGFLKFSHNGFDTADPPLSEIHTNCLILLYRILFILYAESRDLLPLDNRDYALQYSLDYLATDIHEKLDGDIAFAPGASRYWTGLRQLFTLINDGWDDHIPQYNGGLFNPNQHLFLERYGIGDNALAQVIELLTRTEKGERIAYRDLDVRHLGDIYEGLLEYQLQIAEQDLVIVSRKGSETVAPQSSPNQEIAYPEGAVYLLTDKGERKATGSYYTPDYIVRYIVENTLAPLCEGKTVDEILSLKILDPATGSGHFLVGVVDYLAEELITHPDAPHMTKTGSEETELAYWRRRVVESCVYGVDLNPMAVELAKLSLWLHTVAKGEPLSFLDHHIRCGNSLIGAKIENLSNLPELKKSRRKSVSIPMKSGTSEAQTEIPMEFPFTDRVATAIGHYLLIEEIESSTAEQIHKKEEQLETAQKMLRFHKGVANLWTSLFFGNAVSRTEYHTALKALRSKKMAELEAMPPYCRAQKIAKGKQFFHWEIEFPEVFRDKHGGEKDNPGFDAVIGNPPYVKSRMGNDIRRERRIISSLPRFRALSHMWDLYIAFMESAFQLVKTDSFVSVIIPEAFNTATYSKPLKAEYLDHMHVVEVSHFPDVEIFPGVGVRNIILIVHNVRVDDCKLSKKIVHSGLSPQSPRICSNVPNNSRELYLATDLGPTDATRYKSISEPLGHLCYVTYGLRLNSSEHVNQGAFTKEDLLADSKDRIHSRVFVEGRALERYGITYTRFLEWSTERCPKNLVRPTFPELYEPTKLLLGRQTRAAAFDDNQVICDNTVMVCFPCVALHGVDNSNIERYFSNLELPRHELEERSKMVCLHFLIGILNSTLGQRMLDSFRPGALDAYPDDWKKLPIRRINFTTPADERARQIEKAKTLYQHCLDRGSIDCVLGFVKHHLAPNPERSDIVHDLLAFLAEQMIEMNKTKGEEIRGFLRWLEREIEIEIDTLKNKTKIQAYFDLSFEALLEILKRNRRSIPIDLSNRDFQEWLEREFTNSLAKLNPLFTRIQGTDALIDQVVYQLYGLNDEEIAIVVR